MVSGGDFDGDYEPAADSPTLREDLSKPVAKEHCASLPRNPHGQFDKSCFVYDSEAGEYRCPQGRVLRYRETRNRVVRRRYRSLSCEGCPLSELCLQPPKKKTGKKKARTGRTTPRARSVLRDEHTDVRERTAQRMSTPESEAIFDRRSAIAETPFGYLKGVLGLRQFRHAGLDKVEQEWMWACLSLNMKKVIRVLARLRRMAADALAGAETVSPMA